MRAVALGLLVAAAVVYLVTLGSAEYAPSGVWGYVNAMAEAAMVGALADWFAVTALFRHPLGIPIPHTALVPRRKAELGRSLQDFVTEHFLTEQVARDRVTGLDVPLRLGHWLACRTHRDRVLREGVQIGRAALERLDEQEVGRLVGDVLAPRLVQEPVSEIAGELLEQIVKDRAHVGLVNLVAGEVHDWLVANPDAFGEVVERRAPWWSPHWVDARVVSWTYQQAVAWVVDIRDDPAHRTRRALDGLLLQWANDLQHDREVMARAEALKETLLTHPQVAETATSLFATWRGSVYKLMDSPDSALYERGDYWVQRLSARLIDDAPLRARLETHLGDAVAFVVRTYGHEMAGAISHTIDQWDGRDAAQRIELHVGRDLQFIRINGTVIGALAGLVIHAVGQLVG
ncbi:MAG: DUF445 domain-containing protein [Micrococcales bacterium]|nr:MAG: DUF445 domain-containing protein [Micrococcales bacterium]